MLYSRADPACPALAIRGYILLACRRSFRGIKPVYETGGLCRFFAGLRCMASSLPSTREEPAQGESP
ncbi:hypothetical protein ASZ90_010645 [hydrocarbon metagenome]|uniref:Uncharacterized protein n=1 Tax=hydrocarbon metagenome TaxID=938273 RepID=A0A0W8FG50_9ZZZZ